MRFAAGPPHMWRVHLKSGAEIEVWADCHDTEPVDGQWQFGVIVDASAEERRAVRVASTTVPSSERCLIVVARIPAREVESIEGGWPLMDDPRANEE